MCGCYLYCVQSEMPRFVSLSLSPIFFLFYTVEEQKTAEGLN